MVAPNRVEPVVAVDPAHPSTVAVASNPNYAVSVNGTHPPGFFVSHDGGRSFAPGLVPMRPPYVNAADPSLAVARSGTVFFGFLGEAPSYFDCSGCGCRVTGPSAAVMVARSTDAGRSFHPPVTVELNSNDDRPYIAVESVPGHKAHVFVTWSRGGTEIWFARSLDGGVTFSRPRMLYASSAENHASVPVVGPNGQVVVFWSEVSLTAATAVSQAKVEVRVSHDDGASFGPVRLVSGPFWAVPRMSLPYDLRTPGTLTAAASPDGALYAAWPQAGRRHPDGSVDADIAVTRSTDGGATWSRPVHANDVRRADRFMPSLSLLRDGTVGVAFYDRRQSPSRLEIYAARLSFDSGVHRSRNVQVSRILSPVTALYEMKPGQSCFSPGRFFGDYMGTAPGPGNTLYVTWGATRATGSNQVDIWLARVRLPPAA
jgi:hypothetical protein